MLLIINEKIDGLDIQIKQQSNNREVCNRLQEIEGIGPITALAIIALVGDGQGFKNGRHFSAYLGLVPKQHSSGQREKLLGISKRGDVYLLQIDNQLTKQALLFSRSIPFGLKSSMSFSRPSRLLIDTIKPTG